jgi:heterogeneous nuclear ribonucleoprotein A1/A3
MMNGSMMNGGGGVGGYGAGAGGYGSSGGGYGGNGIGMGMGMSNGGGSGGGMNMGMGGSALTFTAPPDRSAGQDAADSGGTAILHSCSWKAVRPQTPCTLPN